MKENVIIVGDYNRNDFLYVASVIFDYYNIYFLEYIHKSEIKSDKYKKYGKAIFWSDYKNAFGLLKEIKPKLVLFYFIESFNHVALNVTCKRLGVRTYHIEHGIRNYELLKANIDKINDDGKRTFGHFFTRLNNIGRRIKGRLFFKNTVRALPIEYSSFLKKYFLARRSKSIFYTFKEINDPLRIADAYISFSPKVFEFHQQSDHLPENYPVHFIGCPAFDYLNEYSRLDKHGQDIFFIDSAFEVQAAFGWNNENKMQFLNELTALAADQKRKLWIKMHPYSNPEVYQHCCKNNNVHIINDEKDFKESILRSQIVIGFYSTLLMPLMAFDHTVCFALEMHPTAAKEGLSSFLVKTGAIKQIDSWENLALSFENIDMISKEQKKRKQQFIDDWLFKFDGRSTERLRAILLNEIS